MTATTMNVNAVIDQAKFKPFHLTVVLWCLFVVLFDGYDLAINGVALPLLMKEWGMTAVQAGMLASTALAGMMFGAMLFWMLADKIGSKKVGTWRLSAGLGIGGGLRSWVALASEYAPQKFRSTLVTAMFSGYAMGGIMAALLGVAFTPTFGWKIMFFIAGIPLLFIPILWKFLPESVTFLVKDQQTEKARSIIQRLVPEETVTSDTVLVLNEAKVPDASVAALFKNGRGMGTVLFWCCFFMCLLMVYALGSWLPKLMMAAGYSMGSSLMFLLSLNIGAVIGTAGGGVLADRFHLKPVIISMLTVGAFALVGLGFNSPQPVIYLLVALAGAASIGCSILLYSYVAQYYPLAVRSTGLGIWHWPCGCNRGSNCHWCIARYGITT